jgi:hypothetical protein
METSREAQQQTEAQQMLRQLFDAAAAKSLVVVSRLDAEPEMARFLHAVKAQPDQRAFVVQLFTESFSENFYMRWPPTDFLEFCMHDLRWPEIRDFVRSKKNEEVKKRGAACSGVWNDILESFEDKWESARYFREFATQSS